MIFSRNKKKIVEGPSADKNNIPGPSADNRSHMEADQRKGSITRLIALSSPYKLEFALAIFCMLLLNAAVLLKPWILKESIDGIFLGQRQQTIWFNLTSLGIGYILVTLLGGLFSYFQVNLVNRAGQRIIHNLRCNVFSTILHLPLSWLNKTPSGRLITRATNDISEISEFYTEVTVNIMKDIILIIGIAAAMFLMSPMLSLISLSVIPPMALLVLFIKNRIRQNFFSMKHYIGRLNGFTAESLSGMQTIQALCGEFTRNKAFLKLNDGYFKTTLVQVHLNSFLKPASELFQNLSIALLIAFGIGQVTADGLPIGVLFAFTTYIRQFFGPISDLADRYNAIQSAIVSAERVFGILDEEPNLEKLEEGVHFPVAKGRVEFKNVWFAYRDNEWVLKNVSFVVEAGETAAFVGETGAGKTTIMNLVCAFYEPQKGSIHLDGVPVSKIRKSDLRRRVATVFQDVFLFAGNIRDNITLNDETSDQLLDAAIKASCADSLVDRLPNGLDEMVTERGSTLSSGERQLVSFARAIAHDPAVLVMDEATANIDASTEKLIQEAMEHITESRTILAIAHRLSTIQNADLICVMRHGEIVERGTHDSLFNQKGYYHSLTMSDLSA